MNTKQAISTRIGLITGALLLILGIWLVAFKPDANKPIAYFMIVYGAFRLGLSAYATFLRSKKPNDENTDNNPS